LGIRKPHPGEGDALPISPRARSKKVSASSTSMEKGEFFSPSKITSIFLRFIKAKSDG
jgi:hypothetical protein